MPLLPHYKHIVNPKLKHIYLTFNNEGDLIIKSPKISQQNIEQLLLKKASWISKSRKKIQMKKGKKINFADNNELYFLGKAYKLTLKKHTKKHTKLIFNGDIFIIYYSIYNENIFHKHIDNFYKEEAKKIIPKLVELWSDSMDLQANLISFRKTKRQWGSCSVKNNLSFNSMMMKLPLDVIEYIVVHEITHIKYKHHQKSFWKLIEHYLPDYKRRIDELKNFTT